MVNYMKNLEGNPGEQQGIPER